MKKFLIFTPLIILFTFVISDLLNAQSYLNFPQDTLAKDEFFNYRCMTRFDANGKIHMVNSRQFDTQSDTREIFYRTNTSGTLVTTRITNNSVDDNYAILGFDQQGFVHIGWERRDASNNFQLIYANNRNGNFDSTVWITIGGVNKATPFMATGKDSTVHFVYYTYATGNNNAYYRNYNFITKVLGPETLLGPASTGSENDIEVAVDNNNKIHIIYSTNTGFNGGALKYFTNENGTLSEISTGITANGEYPDITISNTNVVNIVYRFATDKRLYVLRRNAGSGAAFETPLAITPGSIGNPSYWRTIDTDDNGRLYVTYQNSTAPAAKGFFLVHGTTSFVQPILIFEDSSGTYSGRISSSVAAKGNGEIAVTYETSVLRNGNICADIFFKKGTLTITGIHPSNEVAKGFVLEQNYPNPFNPATTINYQLPKSQFVTLKVFDINGKQIAKLFEGTQSAGSHFVDFDASAFASGTYFYKLESADFSETKRMTLVK